MINLPIGQILLSSNLITREQLSIALEHQKRIRGARIGEILLKLDFIDELQYLQALSERLDLPFSSEEITEVDERLSKLINEETAYKYTVMPVKAENGQIHILIDDPLNFYALDDLHILTGYRIKPILSTKKNIRSSIEKSYQNVKKKVGISFFTDKSAEGTLLGDLLYFLQQKGYRNVQAKQSGSEIDVKITL